MADSGMVALREALGKILETEHADLLREGLALLSRELMEAEAAPNGEWLIQKRYLSLYSLATLSGADHGPFGPAEAGQPALQDALAGLGKNTT